MCLQLLIYRTFKFQWSVDRAVMRFSFVFWFNKHCFVAGRDCQTRSKAENREGKSREREKRSNGNCIESR